MENIIELAVIEIEAFSRLHDLWVRVDLLDADNRLIFDDRIPGSEASAGRAVAKKLIMTNEKKILLFLGKEFLYYDVILLKVGARS